MLMFFNKKLGTSNWLNDNINNTRIFYSSIVTERERFSALCVTVITSKKSFEIHIDTFYFENEPQSSLNFIS